jgi:predicted phosphoribosyltransferase
MGAIADGAKPVVVRNEDVIRWQGVTEFQFKSACDRELKEIDRRRLRYLGGRPSTGLAGRTVIIVDDGIATGATVRATLRATRKRGPAKLILAVPVAATDTLQALRKEADEVICLEDHEDFDAIGFFYDDFRQVGMTRSSRCSSDFRRRHREPEPFALLPSAVPNAAPEGTLLSRRLQHNLPR